MAVTTSWIALETSCQEALGSAEIGYRIKENLDRAIARAFLPPLDWSRGTWQKVRVLQERRKTYVHRFLSLQDMFPEAIVAEEAIDTVRFAVGDIYLRVTKPAPTWLALNETHGWQVRSSFGMPTLTAGYHGAKMEDPNTVRIYMVINGEEKLTTVLPTGHDPNDAVASFLNNLNVPISAIRVYDSGLLIRDFVVNMRGNE
jgi:hypothetical protein